MLSASIIIATYNRAPLLDDCLRHLARQQFLQTDEVLVADNGSSDATQAVIARHARGFPVRLAGIHEATPGKSHALAAALAQSAGAIAAFTDDDVQVMPDWLVALRHSFLDPSVALVGGPVEPRWERPAPRWLRLSRTGYGRLAAPIGLLDYGPAPAPLGARTLLGANMAVRRDVLDRVGGFAPHLGKLRGTLLSGEDHELCERIQSSGFRALYLPSARVRHRVPRARMRFSYFLNWFYWSGITHATIDAGSRGAAPRMGLSPHLFRQFACGLSGAAWAALRGALPDAVDRSMDAAFAVGYAARRLNLVGLALPQTPAPSPVPRTL